MTTRPVSPRFADAVPAAPRPSHAVAHDPGVRLFDGLSEATADYLYDLAILRDTLAEILDSGIVRRRPRWRERPESDGLVGEPVTPAQRARWTAMLEQVRAEQVRVYAALEAAAGN